MIFEEIIQLSRAPEKLRRFVECYRGASSGGAIAVQSALPMRTLAPLMAHVTLLERVEQGRILYRIAGERIVERLGFNPLGHNFLDLIVPELKDTSILGHEQMLNHPCGYYMIYESAYESGQRVRAETLTLPLRKEADGALKYFLSLHLDHEMSGLSDRPGQTALVTDWITNTFVDIGHGEPDEDLMPTQDAAAKATA
ncbi:MAG: PAS domain-containing protein [Parvibaculaceae bacterium]